MIVVMGGLWPGHMLSFVNKIFRYVSAYSRMYGSTFKELLLLSSQLPQKLVYVAT